MTVTEVTELLSYIADAFPGRVAVSKSMLALWAEMLADLPASEALGALKAYLADGPPHPPAISDVRKRVADARVAAIDFGAAWGEVQRATQRVGYLGTPTWSHPAIAYAVECLGWRTICHTLDEDLNTLRAQFKGYVQGYLDGARRTANVGALEQHQERVGQLGAGAVLARLQLKPGGGS